MKRWATTHSAALYAVLGDRYIMYGEWLYAKHTIYYDALPHYFMEFDIFDRKTERFLDTASRHEMLRGLPVVSAPVLARAAFKKLSGLVSLLGPSNYIRKGHMDRLNAYCAAHGEDAALRARETDPSVAMEGLYIKVEESGTVLARVKYVRATFSQRVDNSGSNWLDRPIVPNGLIYPLDELFKPALPEAGEYERA